MKRLFVFYALLFLGSSLFSQVGRQFPVIGGNNLEGKNIELPMKNNKFSVIGIAYNRAAEKELKEWLNPMYSTFIQKDNGGAFDIAAIYDVNFMFIPMVSGFKNAAHDFKMNTDKEFWPYIMDAATDIKTIKEYFKIENDKQPYFYVVDKTGKIVATASGKFSEDKMSKLEDVIE